MDDIKHTDQMANFNWAILFCCWLVAAVSSLGSLFFSEVMEFPPCALCWYQRIFMFPLVVILISGLFPFDKNIIKYALPLALLGWGAAFYHYLIYSGYIPKRLQPCGEGVSCSETYIDLFGFLTIPMLSLISFSMIIGLLLFLQRRVTR